MAIQDPLTELIIGCCFRVANELGPGFLEKVYENALAHELWKAKVNVVQQQGIEVFYDGVNVGNYEADLLVEGRVLVEVKAVSAGSIRNFVFGRVSSGLDLQVQGCGRSKCWG